MDGKPREQMTALWLLGYSQLPPGACTRLLQPILPGLGDLSWQPCLCPGDARTLLSSCSGDLALHTRPEEVGAGAGGLDNEPEFEYGADLDAEQSVAAKCP